GINGWDTLTTAFVMPAVGATATATVDQAIPPFAVGEWVFVQGVGYLMVTAIAGSTLTLRNDGSSGNQPPGTTAAIGNLVARAGGPGRVGRGFAPLAPIFAMPAAGAGAVATTGEPPSPFGVGKSVFIANPGWLFVPATAGNTMTLRNDGSTGNQPAGTVAP